MDYSNLKITTITFSDRVVSRIHINGFVDLINHTNPEIISKEPTWQLADYNRSHCHFNIDPITILALKLFTGI